MYDAEHRFHALSTIPEQRNFQKRTGLWERLLCDRCEEKLSKWEDYASQVLNGGVPLGYTKKGSACRISGIDYEKFKLFQLSILWRASVLTLRFFKNVSLGPHEKTVQAMLRTEDPGAATKYGCIMFCLKFNGVALADLMIQPGRVRVEGHIVYRLVFGGFLWAYFVSKHSVSPKTERCFPQPSGSIVLFIKDAETAENLVRFGQELIRLGRM
jgi:hypothetical protein